MNRREVLSSLGGILAGGSVLAVGNQPEELPKPEFRLIDERLSGHLSIQNLQEGECAYTSILWNALFVKSESGLLWFNFKELSNPVVGFCYAKEEDHFVWVGKKNNELRFVVLKPMRDKWSYYPSMGSPAQLAYNQCYPLLQDGPIYVIPETWEACKLKQGTEKSLMDSCFEHLISGVYQLSVLEKNGLYCKFDSQDCQKKYIKEVLGVQIESDSWIKIIEATNFFKERNGSWNKIMEVSNLF